MSNAEDKISEAFENREELEDEIEHCPVEVLGTYNGRYYFIKPSGELRSYTWKEFNQKALEDLFCGRVGWLCEHFPPPDEAKGKKKKKKAYTDEFSERDARRYFFDLADRRGLFNDAYEVRSIGIWRSVSEFKSVEADNFPNKIKEQVLVHDLIVHCGDRLWTNDGWRAAGFIDEGVIYPAAPKIKRFAAQPSSIEDGMKLLEGLNTWNFELSIGAEIALGLIGQALIAGALDWKAHGMFYGEAGSGKTTLARYMGKALGAAAHPASNNFTEAGLRQAMTNQALAFLLDETEANGIGKDMRAVVEMLRQMSSGDGAHIKRGSSGGQSMSYRLNGCAMMFCILPPYMEPQDRSRITRLRIFGHQNTVESGGDQQYLARLLKETEALSPHYRARAILGWERFHQTLYAYRSFMSAEGVDNRACDQLATILAGRDLLVCDTVPDFDRVYDGVRNIQPLIDEWIEQKEEGSEGLECLYALYGAESNYIHQERRITVGELIALVREGGTDREKKALEALGLRVKYLPSHPSPCLMVSNKHEGLRRLYRGTKWENQGWKTSLSYIKGAESFDKTVRFGTFSTRATLVPREYLPSWEEKSGDNHEEE